MKIILVFQVGTIIFIKWLVGCGNKLRAGIYSLFLPVSE